MATAAALPAPGAGHDAPTAPIHHPTTPQGRVLGNADLLAHALAFLSPLALLTRAGAVCQG